MTNHEARTDVLVIGGGLSGLTAAAYLARAGQSVRVLERAGALGGRASTDEEHGFLLNRGPHAVYRSGEMPRILSDLGVSYSAGAAPLSGWALRGGRLHKLPVGSASLVSTGLLGWSEKARAASWLVTIPRLDPAAFAGVSVAEWLREGGADAETSELIAAFVRVSSYANALELFSAATAIGQLQKARGGVLYVDGGWQALVDGLAARARALGAVVEPGARAVRLHRAGHDFVVELAAGGVVRSGAVVLAVPMEVARALLSSAGATFDAQESVPVRMATLDLGLSHVPVPAQRFVLGIDQPLYLSVHSGVAKLGERGAVVHAAKYLSGKETDPEADLREIESMLDVAQPGWRAAVLHSRYLPRMVVAERLDVARTSGPLGRPGCRVANLPGVVLAGDWVRGGSWLGDGAMEAGRQAARVLLEDAGRERAVA